MRRLPIHVGVLILIAPLSGSRHRLRAFCRETDWESVVPNALGWGVETACDNARNPPARTPRAETPERKPERVVRAEKAKATSTAHESPNDHP